MRHTRPHRRRVQHRAIEHPAVRRLIVLLCVAGASATVAAAQETAHLEMRVVVLPAALRVTVTSSQIDFAQQAADAGSVQLDPVTGEISTKVAGGHHLGEVRLSGPARSAYGISVTPTPGLRHAASASLPVHTAGRVRPGPVAFRLRWARADGCRPTGLREIHDTRSAEGQLGIDGCSVVRFGGALALSSGAVGPYRGSLHVSIFTL